MVKNDCPGDMLGHCHFDAQPFDGLSNHIMDQHKTLSSLDFHRDGGSLGVSFKCDDTPSTLFFEIGEDWELICDDETACQKYKCPVLKEFHTFQWTNKVGGIIDDTLHSTLPVSWETAREILRELAPQTKNFISTYLWVFDEAVCVAETEGTGLPGRGIHCEDT